MRVKVGWDDTVEGHQMDPCRTIRQLRVLAYETIRLHEETYGQNAWLDDADNWLKERLEQMIVIADRAEAEKPEYDLFQEPPR